MRKEFGGTSKTIDTLHNFRGGYLAPTEKWLTRLSKISNEVKQEHLEGNWSNVVDGITHETFDMRNGFNYSLFITKNKKLFEEDEKVLRLVTKRPKDSKQFMKEVVEMQSKEKYPRVFVFQALRSTKQELEYQRQRAKELKKLLKSTPIHDISIYNEKYDEERQLLEQSLAKVTSAMHTIWQDPIFEKNIIDDYETQLANLKQRLRDAVDEADSADASSNMWMGISAYLFITR